MKIKVGILGATGYTGAELIRLLAGHPNAELKWLTSESFTDKKISEVFPTFRSLIDLECKSVRDIDKFNKVDVVFSCLPHGTSSHFAHLFLDKGTKFIDFSSDLRFNNSQLSKKAIYGLPEFLRKKIKNADLVANPGCYATAVILGLAPLVKNKLIESNSINIDAKAGLSGGGRAPVGDRQFSEVNDTISVNSISGHNQKAEIEEQMKIRYKTESKLVFTAYNVNVDRGILTTISARLNASVTKDQLLSKYKSFYKNERFIRIIEDEKMISTKNVRFSNYCDIGATILDAHIICVTALDNLGKGAAGQAVQNMNLMFNIEESAGLLSIGLLP
ncbi:MAG: N-acetyl-gamma-glutamyl-phosphate reductase [Candidatus Dadabacteria bacterium]|nr:N-acetyl-gamma-glutamyl-phosphate reductase [Candidatus Dadabacteria bacterium]NIS08647.1 N-acetyl-gamma-glutamyl-phosphate reductase [Candidatus Dadabacteria bacterium]NIV42481.1 N-acetyl-gamma-glutamyl-phosphate reductase [Candidatus Dadabacteria bacterium]NIX15363.1 N-acetyl-gamma-glutamyl-phosphate reductase [Candidatus Dadabacteria bacterium]NIY22022.1 N-acetyl-gamma-glutamyl-phosphate reductase [Candidatus Dadabacteria bacterium]